MTKRLSIHMDEKPCYDILYSTDPGDLTRELGTPLFAGRRIAIITDTNVAPLYAEMVADCCVQAAQSTGGGSEPPLILRIPAGEENKTLDQIRILYRELILHHFDRRSLLIALGGGVVGDMTGYAAATFLRGIDFIQIPTTLLAQADSSIGGKTGVDFDGFKNMVGAFKMPRLVYANVSLLTSLDERQYISGLAEIIKHGLIRDAAYYDWLRENREAVLRRDTDVMQQMLYVSNRIKQEAVERDPYEKNERMLLNFGHTIGHAIEKNSGFSLTHGECVALGSVAAAWISFRRGNLSEKTFLDLKETIAGFGLPVRLGPDTGAYVQGEKAGNFRETILTLTKSDKKAVSGNPRFVLLREIGDAYVTRDVTDDEIRSAISAVSE